MQTLNVLLLGSGAREHALALKLFASHLLNKLYIAPGNAGMRNCGELVPELSVTDFPAIQTFCEDYEISLIVVGPEQPLVEGIWDYFQKTNIKVFGPSARGAKLEGSKLFAKKFMEI